MSIEWLGNYLDSKDPPAPVTAREKAAFSAGRVMGYEEGYDEGESNAHDLSYDKGFQEGYDQAWTDVRDRGGI